MAKQMNAQCPQCGKQLIVTAPDNVSQGSVKCTQCGHKFTVTFPPTWSGPQQPPQTPFAGDDKTILPQGGKALFLAVMRWLAFNIPMLFLLNWIFGMYGIVWAQVTADVLTVSLSFYVLLRYEKRKFADS